MEPLDETFLEHLQAIYLSDLTSSDFYVPFLFCFWCLILFLSLRGIDSQHGVTAATYVAACTFLGVLQVIALPRALGARSLSWRNEVLLFGVFITLATIRWLLVGMGHHGPRYKYKKSLAKDN